MYTVLAFPICKAYNVVLDVNNAEGTIMYERLRKPLPNGNVFCAYVEESGEVYGWCESVDGEIVRGSGGWWRTDSLETAGLAAEFVYA